MTLVETPPVALALTDLVRRKLREAPAPFKLADVAKGLPRPAKMTVARFQEEVRRIIEEEVTLGNVFRSPSGPKKADRYWGKDENEALRREAVRAAAEPLSLSKLADAARLAAKGADKKYVEGLIKELVGDGRLHLHRITASTVKYAAHAQPALEQPQLRKFADALDKAARKLQKEAALTAEQVLEFLRARLSTSLAPPALPPVRPQPEPPAPPVLTGPLELDALILKVVTAEGGTDGTVSIPALRRQMPHEYRGAAFDEAVFRLADEDKVFLVADNRAGQLGPAELSELLRDNDTYFAQIGLRE